MSCCLSRGGQLRHFSYLGPPSHKCVFSVHGVLAGPRTPRDPKSHLFVTKWVAIRPFCVFLRPVCAEFRSGARQIGPTPSISTFVQHFFDPKIHKMPKSGHVFEGPETARAGLAIPPHGGPRGRFSRILKMAKFSIFGFCFQCAALWWKMVGSPLEKSI